MLTENKEMKSQCAGIEINSTCLFNDFLENLKNAYVKPPKNHNEEREIINL